MQKIKKKSLGNVQIRAGGAAKF